MIYLSRNCRSSSRSSPDLTHKIKVKSNQRGSMTHSRRITKWWAEIRTRGRYTRWAEKPRTLPPSTSISSRSKSIRCNSRKSQSKSKTLVRTVTMTWPTYWTIKKRISNLKRSQWPIELSKWRMRRAKRISKQQTKTSQTNQCNPLKRPSKTSTRACSR